MNVSAVPEKPFLSAIQPNTPVSTYAVPSEIQLEHKGSIPNDVAKNKRVHQQVQMRMAEKFPTLPQMNGSYRYASTEFGGSSTMKYSTYSPAFSSASYKISGSQTIPNPQLIQYSSRSVVEAGPRGGGVNGLSQARSGTLVQSASRVQGQVTPREPKWITQDLVDGGLRMNGGTLQRHSIYSENEYSSQLAQAMSSGTMPRSLSGTLAGGGGSGTGVTGYGMVPLTPQSSFKGPAHRTLTRMNRAARTPSMCSSLPQQMSAGGTLQRQSLYSNGFSGQMGEMTQVSTHLSQQQIGASLPHNGSMKSLGSVSKAVDIERQMDVTDSIGKFNGTSQLDMSTAVSYLSSSEPEIQVQGAAFIQHECYHKAEAKAKLRELKGIPALVELFSSNEQEVQRYATGAMRNAVYEYVDNKVALVEAGGIPEMMKALKEPDIELRKNVTGILWNLSSKDTIKEKVARETLSQLTETILVPLSGGGDSDTIQQNQSEVEIFCNTTGCLRNLSSQNEKIRTKMRETSGLVECLVNYIENAVQDGHVESKGVENSMCVLRNLSYQMYSEMPHSTLVRLEGSSRARDTDQNNVIGCFSPQGKKAKEKINQDLSALTEVAKQPKGQEWLWHPQIVTLYNRMLQKSEGNTTTREAAAGALNNITGGNHRWASVLSRVALERERMLPVLLDCLRTDNDLELRALTSFLRNLSRYCRNKDDMATKMVSSLMNKLPGEGWQKEPSSEVVINICGILNNLVASSSVAAREIASCNGLQKLVAIKGCQSNSTGKANASKAAATVLSNMFQYKKLHKDYKEKGFSRKDFCDLTN